MFGSDRFESGTDLLRTADAYQRGTFIPALRQPLVSPPMYVDTIYVRSFPDVPNEVTHQSRRHDAHHEPTSFLMLSGISWCHRHATGEASTITETTLSLRAIDYFPEAYIHPVLSCTHPNSLQAHEMCDFGTYCVRLCMPAGTEERRQRKVWRRGNIPYRLLSHRWEGECLHVRSKDESAPPRLGPSATAS